MTLDWRPGVVGIVVGLGVLAGACHPTTDGGRDAARSPTEPSEPAVADPSASVVETFWVSPSGDDSASGSSGSPFETLQFALERLGPGDRLVVGGGRYREIVEMDEERLRPGRRNAPVVVEAAPGERPVLEGRLRLSGADHWTIRGLDVTWPSGDESDDHMVQFWGGTGWRFTESELSGARTFSALNVDNGATDFRLDHLYVHDTHETNDRNQDHLVYIARGNSGGVIEYNVLANSPNGRGIKVGPASVSDRSSSDIVIRYNTFFDNQGPSNIRLSGDTTDVCIYGNIMVRPDTGEAAVTAHRLSGDGNVVGRNVIWEATAAVASTSGLVDVGDNVEIDPQFTDPSRGDYRPTNPEARKFGAHADPVDPPSIPPWCQSGVGD